LVWIITWGPIKPDNTPPKSTQEIAEALSAAGTLSAIAKRYWFGKAEVAPRMAIARQKSQMFAVQAEYAARMAAGIDTAAPKAKASRRPQVWMSHAAGPVATAVPTTIIVTGNVA
jgi:hypothetical protein